MSKTPETQFVPGPNCKNPQNCKTAGSCEQAFIIRQHTTEGDTPQLMLSTRGSDCGHEEVTAAKKIAQSRG